MTWLFLRAEIEAEMREHSEYERDRADADEVRWALLRLSANKPKGIKGRAIYRAQRAELRATDADHRKAENAARVEQRKRRRATDPDWRARENAKRVERARRARAAKGAA